MITGRRSWSVLLFSLAALSACATGADAPDTLPTDWPTGVQTEPSLTPELQQEILEYADQLLEDAAEAECWITPSLEYLIEVRGGRLEGLEHRLKGRGSLIRKIYSRWDEDQSVNPSEIDIDDPVRYLLVVNDSPPGHTDASIREIFEIMEGIGHNVVQIKNYWPRGDDYSGVNGVMRAPNGISWELQFHTDSSLQAKERVHPIYEVYRLTATPLETKRELYDQMREVWEDVAIPAGILEPGSLHPLEEILRKPPP